MDYNIDNYSIEDIQSLFNINNISSISQKQIISRTDTIIQEKKVSNNSILKQFLVEAREKLLQYKDNLDTCDSDSSTDDENDTTMINISSTNNINLDLNSYTLIELQNIFKLQKDYTKKELENEYEIQITNLNNNTNITLNKKEKLLFFFNRAYTILLEKHLNSIYGSEYTNTVPATQQQIQINQNRTQLMLRPDVVQNNDSFVIQHPNMKTQDIFTSEYSAGTLNKIRKQVVKQLVNVDTIFRSNYSTTKSSDFIYTLPMPINNVVSMKLSTVEMPNTWYLFSEEKMNNVFYVDISSTGTWVEIKIPEGNYTNSNLEDVLNLLFIEKGLNIKANMALERDKTEFYYDGSGAGVPASYSLSFVVPEKSSRNIRHNCGWSLGFRKASYVVDTTTTGRIIISGNPTSFADVIGYISSEGMFGSNKENYTYISINDFVGNKKDSIISGLDENTGYFSKDILGRVTVRYGSYYVNIDDSSDFIFKQRDYFGPVRIEKIHIKIFDKFGEIMDLNNNDYSFALEFTQLYS